MLRPKIKCKEELIIEQLSSSSKTSINEGFKSLYQCYKRALEGPPRRSGALEAEIRDHVQNTMEKIFKEYCLKGRELKNGSLGGLIAQISKFLWINRLKKAKLQEAHQADAALINEKSPQRTDFSDWLRYMKGDCKTLLYNRLVRTLTFLEIAEEAEHSNSEKFRKKYYHCIEGLRKQKLESR